MIYARRYIDVTLEGKGGTVTFNGRGKYALRTSARILKAGGFNLGTAEIDIYGLSLAHIIQLSTFGTRIHPNYNYRVTVQAGDEVNGMSTVFVGGVQQAWGDMQAMPDVPFHIVAASGGSAAVMTAQPSSYQGSADVPTMLQKLASTASLQFENNGVNAKLADPYFWGSPWKQMKEIIDAASIDGFIDDETLAIWPRNSGRSGSLYVSPQTGMRAYPSFTEYGVRVVVEFKRSIPYRSSMTIQSDITPACGTWQIIRIDYNLQSNTPGKSSWFAVLDGAALGAPVMMP